MNGIHDMGGMHGFGPVEREANEPVFHAGWEARLFAVRHAMGAWGKWNIDGSRYAREIIPPAEYLRMSYYERWLAGLITQMIEVGLVTREEVQNGHPSPGAKKATPALAPDAVDRVLARSPSLRDVPVSPRFKPGDRVRTHNMNPEGHTRLPRYARAKTGTVVRYHGAHVFPDTSAHGRGENPQPLYCVRFEGNELWGDAACAREAVHLDLWESYLEPA
ncbi:MAG: nitrile hydratase subunit beta [Betaproteobacteria bacterium]|nr:MAG: nitrile hydratase subunit beta [Betaproteobacteria bacterium]